MLPGMCLVALQATEILMSTSKEEICRVNSLEKAFCENFLVTSGEICLRDFVGIVLLNSAELPKWGDDASVGLSLIFVSAVD